MFLDLAGKRQNRLIQSVSHAMKLLNLMRNLLFVLAALVPPITSASHATWAEPGATASVPPAASTARAGVSAYLALWSTEAHADEAMPFSKDLVLSYSHSIPELRAEVRGRTSAITQVRAVAHLGRQWQFRDVRLFPTLDANVYFAQYTAAGVSTFDGASIEQNVVLCLEVDGSQVVRIVEFANPAIVLANRESMSSLGSR
jgi:ketosteroid isomerase-like protein